jgi:hypothetical protein
MAIRGLEKCVRKADFNDRKAFQDAIWFLSMCGVEESDIAERFYTTASAVNRWINGKSAPSYRLRVAAIEFGIGIIYESGFKMSGRRYDLTSGRPLETPPG